MGNGKRQKIADNYLSLKAYAVSSADKIADYRTAGKGRGLSSIGDLLQVDKVDGKAGNYVFVNGHSVGLSNKLSDFSTLAARMTTYESVLAKLTAKITTPKQVPEFEAPAPEWEGN